MTKSKTAALAEVEANYNTLKAYYYPLLGRTYWTKGWYYLTFKPLDIPYAEDLKWYEINAIKKLYDKFRPLSKIMWLTREITATKIHINMLIYSESDLTKFHDKILYHKVKVYSTPVEYLGRFKVFDYIFKESKERYFMYGDDYKFFDREETTCRPDRL